MPSANDMKLLAVIAALAVAGASAYLLLGSSGNSPAAPIVVTLPTVTSPVANSPSPKPPSKSKLGTNDVGASVPVPHIRLDPAPDAVKGPSFPIATVVAGRQIALHTSPGGPVFEQVGDRTEFGSARVYLDRAGRTGRGSELLRRICRTEDSPGFATTEPP